MTARKPLDEWQSTLPDVLPFRFRRNLALDDQTGCWLWTRSKSPDGYGWASHNDKTHQAHRLAYRLVVGDPAEGLVLDHLCRVRHCVNPAHLEPVTPRTNLERGETPAGFDRCQKCGDEYGVVGGQRRCLRCLAAYEAGRRETKRVMEAARRARMRAAS